MHRHQGSCSLYRISFRHWPQQHDMDDERNLGRVQHRPCEWPTVDENMGFCACIGIIIEFLGRIFKSWPDHGGVRNQQQDGVTFFWKSVAMFSNPLKSGESMLQKLPTIQNHILGRVFMQTGDSEKPTLSLLQPTSSLNQSCIHQWMKLPALESVSHLCPSAAPGEDGESFDGPRVLVVSSHLPARRGANYIGWLHGFLELGLSDLLGRTWMAIWSLSQRNMGDMWTFASLNWRRPSISQDGRISFIVFVFRWNTNPANSRWTKSLPLRLGSVALLPGVGFCSSWKCRVAAPAPCCSRFKRPRGIYFSFRAPWRYVWHAPLYPAVPNWRITCSFFRLASLPM